MDDKVTPPRRGKRHPPPAPQQPDDAAVERESQGTLEAERMAKDGVRKLIDDALAQLGELEEHQRRLQNAWTEFSASRQQAIDDSPQVRALRHSLAVAEEKLAFTRNELAGLAVRFSQKLQKIAELEDDHAALSRDSALQIAELSKALLKARKLAAQRDRDLAALRGGLFGRLMTMLAKTDRSGGSNPLFDAAFYLEQYPDVRAGGMDPYVHYLRHGIVEGRNPHALFDTDWYLERNPDVLQAGIDPLLHFYRFGAAEGREPHPQFLEKHPEARGQASIDVLKRTRRPATS